jgi:DNA polymerase elongation subunit (family B)
MYIDAIFDKKRDVIRVVERIKGERVFNEIPADHVFYFENPNGQHKSIYGDTCKRFHSHDGRKFHQELEKTKDQGKKIFESDINPVFRSLETHYKGTELPTINVAFFDIEVDFSLERGYAPVTDPFNRITAITVYRKWDKQLITLALAPPTLTDSEAQELISDIPNSIICETENELLNSFFVLIEEADLISGWNSTFYDIPYMVERIKLLYKDNDKKMLSKFCLLDQQPRRKEVQKFKKLHLTYDLVGRCHMDYLELYQKHNMQQLHSYRLDYVGEVEVGEHKVQYDGTLDDLYKKDFRKFIEYSRQDVALLDKIDDKKKYIDLSNQIAHANCVLFKTTLGSVALVEQAIILDMHSMGLVVPNRIEKPQEYDDDGHLIEEEEAGPVVGAYVAKPKIGLHEMVGCVDINSLYPSAIRALNMSPETIVGQFIATETEALIAKRINEGVDRAEAWDGIFHSLEYGHILAKDNSILVFEWDKGRKEQRTAKEWYDYIFNPDNHVCITANGTLFSTKKAGVIPALLEKWYAERKVFQANQKEFGLLANGVEVSDEMRDLLNSLK